MCSLRSATSNRSIAWAQPPADRAGREPIATALISRWVRGLPSTAISERAPVAIGWFSLEQFRHDEIIAASRMRRYQMRPPRHSQPRLPGRAVFSLVHSASSRRFAAQYSSARQTDSRDGVAPAGRRCGGTAPSPIPFSRLRFGRRWSSGANGERRC
jgi:hypothetical protein